MKRETTGWLWDRKRKLWYTWEVRTVYLGAQKFERGFATEAAAQQYLDELKIQERLIKLGVVQNVVFPKLEDVINKRLEQIPDGPERQRNRRVLFEFLDLCPKGATIDLVERKHIKDFCDKRIAADVKPTTANREINCISAMILNISDNFTGLEKWQPPTIYRPQVEDDERDRVMRPDEYETLVPYLLRERGSGEKGSAYLARRRTGLMIYFGLLTGLRHGEICGLEKINFDAAARKLKAERFKTRKTGVRWTTFEPLTRSQMSVLVAAAELYPESPYLFSEQGKIHAKFYSILKAACANFNIPYGRSTDGGFIMHDTRHTFVTALEHSGIDSTTTRSFSGHSKERMMKRYSHATVDSRARAMHVIEAKFGEEGNLKLTIEEIYERVAAGEMSLEEFKRAVSYNYLITTSETSDLSQTVANVDELKTSAAQ